MPFPVVVAAADSLVGSGPEHERAAVAESGRIPLKHRHHHCDIITAATLHPRREGNAVEHSAPIGSHWVTATVLLGLMMMMKTFISGEFTCQFK